MRKTLMITVATTLMLAGGAAYAVKSYEYQQTPVEFYAGHSHDEDGSAIGAPEHSGGTNAYGCHNGSVPYHCH